MAVQKLETEGVLEYRAKLLTGMSLAADSNGIQVWGGRDRHPEKLFQIDWARISAVEPWTTQELARNSRGVGFVVPGPTGGTMVPFILTGAGIGNLMPLSEARITAAVESLESLRTASASQRG